MSELSPELNYFTSAHQDEFSIRYAAPDYELPEEKLRLLEADLVEKFAKRFPMEGVYAAWINPHDPYSNVIRTFEGRAFPEAEESFPEESEDNTLLLALVDTRRGIKRITHGATIMGHNVNPKKEIINVSSQSQQGTGFFTIDGLVGIEGNFTAAEFREYHENLGLDLENCIAVETNFRIGERTEPYRGVDSATLGYLAVFNFIMNKAASTETEVAVFANINQPSINSFRRVGFTCDLLMGRDDLITPEQMQGQGDYKPIMIPASEHNRKLFEEINKHIELPTLHF